MKRIAVAVTGIGLAGVVGFYLARAWDRPTPTSSLEPASSLEQGVAPPLPREFASPNTRLGQPQLGASETPTKPVTQPAPEPSPAEVKSPKPPASLLFSQALQTVVSRQASFAEHQAAWDQLKKAGRLDQAITELEQRTAAQPSAPEYPAALGQAYLQKAGSIQDIREQGILGMKADQTFDAALQLDPNHWEARFWKAAAMSYWPVALGKGGEVVAQFLELIQQQEVEAPQPHFAQSYVLLGDQYQKLGHDEYARQVWQRGSVLYPEDPSLGKRLTHQP